MIKLRGIINTNKFLNDFEIIKDNSIIQNLYEIDDIILQHNNNIINAKLLKYYDHMNTNKVNYEWYIKNKQIIKIKGGIINNKPMRIYNNISNLLWKQIDDYYTILELINKYLNLYEKQIYTINLLNQMYYNIQYNNQFYFVYDKSIHNILNTNKLITINNNIQTFIIYKIKINISDLEHKYNIENKNVRLLTNNLLQKQNILQNIYGVIFQKIRKDYYVVYISDYFIKLISENLFVKK